MSARIHARLLWVGLALAAVLSGGPAAQKGAAAEKPATSRWALLIGVDDYTKLQKLQYCGADMKALAEMLAQRGFPQDHVYLLHDKAEANRLRPLKGNIEQELNLMLGLLEKNDLVVFAFSGHGVHLDGKSYLCPAEARLEDPSTLIAVDEVYRRLEQCRAAMKIIMVDACRDDPRPGGTRSAATLAEVKGFSESLERPPRGILLLASCAPGEKSWEEKEFGHGVFMHFVLAGMQGEADRDGDGSVSLVELYKYTNDKTKSYVAKKFADSQRPGLKGDLADDFGLVRVPVEPKPEPKPRESRRQVTAAFTVREGDENGPIFKGARLELLYQPEPGAEAIVLGRATSDERGGAEITVWLDAAQQQRGQFLVAVESGSSTNTWPMPGFPKSLDWRVHVPGRPAPTPPRTPPSVPGAADTSPAIPLGVLWSKLVGLDVVQLDLGLTDRQKAELKLLGDRRAPISREEFAGLRELSSDQRMARMADLRQRMAEQDATKESEIRKVLTPGQIQRLKQIVLQYSGARAIEYDEEVQQALRLNDQQKANLQAIRDAAVQKMRELLEQRGESGREGMREKVQSLATARQEQVMNVLTPGQREKFEAMKGKKIDADLSELMRRTFAPPAQN